jgi:hypothetical protein
MGAQMKTKASSIDEIRQQTKNLIDAHKKSIQDFHENHFPHLFEEEIKRLKGGGESPHACRVCGLKFTDTLGRLIPMGYACAKNDCPSKAVC